MAKKILVIDDDPTVVKLIKSRLEAHSYETITAKDGESGLKKAKEKSPDLIILDIVLPKMDGYTFVKEFRAIAELKAIPIIIITVKEELQDLFRQEGINDYLTKPIDTKDLLDKVKSLIGPLEANGQVS